MLRQEHQCIFSKNSWYREPAEKTCPKRLSFETPGHVKVNAQLEDINIKSTAEHNSTCVCYDIDRLQNNRNKCVCRSKMPSDYSTALNVAQNSTKHSMMMWQFYLR